MLNMRLARPSVSSISAAFPDSAHRAGTRRRPRDRRARPSRRARLVTARRGAGAAPRRGRPPRRACRDPEPWDPRRKLRPRRSRRRVARRDGRAERAARRCGRRHRARGRRGGVLCGLVQDSARPRRDPGRGATCPRRRPRGASPRSRGVAEISRWPAWPWPSRRRPTRPPAVARRAPSRSARATGRCAWRRSRRRWPERGARREARRPRAAAFAAAAVDPPPTCTPRATTAATSPRVLAEDAVATALAGSGSRRPAPRRRDRGAG